MPGVSVKNQLISLIIRHRQLTDRLSYQMEYLRTTLVSELSRSAALLSAPSASIQNLFRLLYSLSGQLDAVRWQYRFEYLTVYDAVVAETDSGLARVNPNFVRENCRDVLMCSKRLDALTLDLRRCLMSLVNCATAGTAAVEEAAILWHVSTFWWCVKSFKQTLTAYTTNISNRSLAPAANQTTDCLQSIGRMSSSVSAGCQCHQQRNGNEEGTISAQKAFIDDVDRLLAQQQQQPAFDTPSTCQTAAVYSSSVIDGLSDNTSLFDSRVICSLSLIHI